MILSSRRTIRRTITLAKCAAAIGTGIITAAAPSAGAATGSQFTANRLTSDSPTKSSRQYVKATSTGQPRQGAESTGTWISTRGSSASQ